VSATALLATGSVEPAYCEISSAYGAISYGGGGAGGGTPYAQAAETTVVTVPAKTVLSEECVGDGTGQYVYNAAITAIRITDGSPGTGPAGLPHHVVPGPPKGPFVIGPPKS
jgi:hypothetical protein